MKGKRIARKGARTGKGEGGERVTRKSRQRV
jgi:hypothetical protein